MAAPVVDSINSGTSNGATTIVITLTNTPPAGGVIAVLSGFFIGAGGSGDVGCVATGGTGVTVTTRLDPNESPSQTIGIWTVEYTTPPTVLTIGKSTPVGNQIFGHAVAVNATGQTASYFDVVNAAVTTGTSTTPTATGLPDLTDATDLVLGVMIRDGATVITGAPGTNWDEVFEADEDNDPEYISVISRAPGATGAFDPTWTLGSSETWYAAGIAIKGTASGGSRPVKMAGEWGGFAGPSGGFAG